MTTRQQESRGLGRKTREEIGKGNPMTALRFKTGEENIRHPQPPFRGIHCTSKNAFHRVRTEHSVHGHFSVPCHWGSHLSSSEGLSLSLEVDAVV